MKLSASVGIGILSLLLGIPAMVYAQDEPKPQQQDEKAEPRQDEAKPKQDEAKPTKQEKQQEKQDEKNTKQQEQESNRSDQQMNTNRSAQQMNEQNNSRNGQNAMASGKSGGHIPDDKFRQHFGRSHTVVINQPTIVEGQPRFQYGGYWFIISQPWPAGWAYSDQCYIDYVDGEYVLFDLMHPGVSIVLNVVL